MIIEDALQAASAPCRSQGAALLASLAEAMQQLAVGPGLSSDQALHLDALMQSKQPVQYCYMSM